MYLPAPGATHKRHSCVSTEGLVSKAVGQKKKRRKELTSVSPGTTSYEPRGSSHPASPWQTHRDTGYIPQTRKEAMTGIIIQFSAFEDRVDGEGGARAGIG